MTGHSRRPRCDLLDAQAVRDLFSYDPDTGLLEWRAWPHARAKMRPKPWIAGGSNGRSGYMRVSIGNRRYLIHRIVWLLVYGRWPSEFVDHINGDRADNRLANLREATASQNQQNSAHRRGRRNGLKGTTFTKYKRWAASITVNGRRVCLGNFATAEDAHAAYVAAAHKYHGEFARVA